MLRWQILLWAGRKVDYVDKYSERHFWGHDYNDDEDENDKGQKVLAHLELEVGGRFERAEHLQH